MLPEEIGDKLNRTRGAIVSRAAVEKLPIPRHWAHGARLTPPKDIWLNAASIAAQEANVPLVEMLAGGRKRPLVRARIAAWKAILNDHPQYSIAGLARVSGFHHTTLLHNFGRLGRGRNNARVS